MELNANIILLGYYTCLGLFALNGILWMALNNKYKELKLMEERMLRLLTRSRIRRVK